MMPFRFLKISHISFFIWGIFIFSILGQFGCNIINSVSKNPIINGWLIFFYFSLRYICFCSNVYFFSFVVYFTLFDRGFSCSNFSSFWTGNKPSNWDHLYGFSKRSSMCFPLINTLVVSVPPLLFNWFSLNFFITWKIVHLLLCFHNLQKFGEFSGILFNFKYNFVWMCVCMHVHVWYMCRHACPYVCRGERAGDGHWMYLSPPCLSETGLSLNLEEVSKQQVPVICLSLLPRALLL